MSKPVNEYYDEVSSQLYNNVYPKFQRFIELCLDEMAAALEQLGKITQSQQKELQ